MQENNSSVQKKVKDDVKKVAVGTGMLDSYKKV